MGRGEQHYLIRLWGGVGIDPSPGALSKRARALLARLALATDNGLDRHALAALLWPERTDAQALANLRQLLHDHAWLSRGEAPLLRVSRDRLWLDQALLATDDAALLAAASGAASLADALSRTEPQFLAGLDGVGEEFDAWRASAQRRAGERLAAAAREAATRALTAGDTAAVARLADAWMRFDPCDEAMTRTGLAADADAAAIRRRMAALVAALAADLGVEPAAETRRAAAAALARVSAGNVDRAAIAGSMPVATQSPVADTPAAGAPRGRRAPIAVLAAAAALAIGGGWWALRPAPPQAPAVSAQARHAEALTLAARQLIATRDRNSYAKAAELARGAIAEAPDYAPAWTELALAIWMPAWWAEQDEPGARERIRGQALGYLDRALALSPGLPRALGAKGQMLAGAEAARLLEAAVAADPPDADLWEWTANARADRGNLRGALAAQARAAAIAPMQHRIVSGYTQLAWRLGRDDLAQAAIDHFAVIATNKYAVEAMRANSLMRHGHLGATAGKCVGLLENGPADPWRALLTLAWMARATGDLAAVRAVTAPHPQLGRAYASIYDPDRVEARLQERPDAFLDNVMADAESRSLLKLGKGRLLLDLAARHKARFVADPAGSCCHDLGANLVVAQRQPGNTAAAAALLARIESDTAAQAAAGRDDWSLPLQRMAIACLHRDPAAGHWLDRAIDRGWRGQEIFFAADPADEPACKDAATQPEFGAARARLQALVANERAAVTAATR